MGGINFFNNIYITILRKGYSLLLFIKKDSNILSLKKQSLITFSSFFWLKQKNARILLKKFNKKFWFIFEILSLGETFNQ